MKNKSAIIGWCCVGNFYYYKHIHAIQSIEIVFFNMQKIALSVEICNDYYEWRVE